MSRSVASFVIAAALGAVLAPAPAPAETTGRVTEAATTLSGCVQDRQRLLVLFMVDESGSLRGTDKQARRVDGLKAALAGFARIAEAGGGGRHPSVRVKLVGFSGVVDPDPEKGAEGAPGARTWDRLDAAHLDAVLAKAEAFRHRDNGADTDYAIAIAAARRILSRERDAQSKGARPPPCQALVWFTDGRYHITQHVGKYAHLRERVPYASGLNLRMRGAGVLAVEAGKRQLCRDEGLMDDLVRDQVVRFTVGLSSQISSTDEGFLLNLSDGTGGCGSKLSSATGAYVSAANANCLFFSFSALLGGPGCPKVPKDICPVSPCRRGRTTFRAIPGLARFLISAATGANGVELHLAGPGGETLRLKPNDSRTRYLSDAVIKPRWLSGTNAAIQAELPTRSRSWYGGWSFSFVDPQATTTTGEPLSTLQLFSDFRPQLSGRRMLVRGETTNLDVQLARAGEVGGGTLVDRASLGLRVFDVNLGRTQNLSAEAFGRGRFRVGVRIDQGSRARSVPTDMTVSFPPVAGVVVEPNTSAFTLDVDLPTGSGFPTIEPGQLELGSISGTGSSSATIVVRGSSKSGGSVWFGQPEIDAPENAGGVGFSSSPGLGSRAHRLVLRRGEVRRVVVKFAPRSEAVGRVRLRLPVLVESDLVRRAETIELDGGFDLYPKPDVPRRLAILLGLLAAGALLPLALLYAINYLGARLPAPQELLVWSRRVRVDLSSGKLLADSRSELEVSESDFTQLSSGGTDRSERRLEVVPQEGATVRLQAIAARRPADLFSGPYAVVSADGAALAAGGPAGLREWEQGRLHEVSLGLIGTWIFVPEHVTTDEDDQSPKQVTGQLVLISGYGSSWDAGPALAITATSALQLRDWSGWQRDPAEVAGRSRLLTRASAVAARLWALLRSRRGESDEEVDAVNNPDENSTANDDRSYV